jgi:acetyltransferase-like isoleucine patch superfamily enzyme
MKYENSEKNIKILAKEINIGKSVQFGRDILITVKGEFRIGNYSRLGDNTQILGNNIILGEHLFNSSGLRIGGGGRQHPNANFKIGDRCTIHNNFINVCEPVEIGDDVGLSPGVDIITHGYWMSVLEGFPASFSGVKIGNGVIIGYKSLILMGVEIADFIVVGANSVVTRSLTKKGIYAGIPARFIKEIVPMNREERIKKLDEIIASYLPIAKYHRINPRIKVDYPWVKINDFEFNVETFEYIGTEDEETDDLRDYIRKWGIRIYTKRPFRSHFTFYEF